MKFIIGTRLYAFSVCGIDASALAADIGRVLWRAELSTRILFPSLGNQTVRDFDHYTLINPVSGLPNAREYADRIAGAGYRTTLVTPSEWREVITGEWKRAGDGICIARMDDDDAVFSRGVELAGASYRKGRFSVYGWTSGLRLRIGEGFIREQRVEYGSKGHFSVMQTCVTDSSAPLVDPYSYDHSDLVPFLVEKGWDADSAKSAIVNGDSDAGEPTYLHIRHPDAGATLAKQKYDVDTDYPRVSVPHDRVCASFGLSPETLGDLLSGRAMDWRKAK